MLTSGVALFYLRRVRLERPAIGTFNSRDIRILFSFIVFLPLLYVLLPHWALTCFLMLTFASALSIGYGRCCGRRRVDRHRDADRRQYLAEPDHARHRVRLAD